MTLVQSFTADLNSIFSFSCTMEGWTYMGAYMFTMVSVPLLAILVVVLCMYIKKYSAVMMDMYFQFLVFIYPTIAARTLVVFKCRSVWSNDVMTQYLQADYRVVCNSDSDMYNVNYTWTQGVAWAVIVIYIVGLPLLISLCV